MTGTTTRRWALRTPVGRLVVATALVIASLPAAGAPVLATYPGSMNGRLLFGANVAGNFDVYSVLPSGRSVQRLTSDAGFDACPASSADGKWIAWCSGVAPVFEIWTMRIDGTQKHQVTTLQGAATFPDFSPDGERIVFTSGTPGVAGSADIYSVDRDGSKLERLTTADGDDRYPAYSPDGSRIVFLSIRSGQWQVWTMASDGSDQTQLTFDPVMKDQVPDWSPDGSQIAFVTRPDPAIPGGDVWLIAADGGRQHPLTTGPEREFGAAWSPDGSSIAFVDFDTTHVTILDVASGQRSVVNGFAQQLVPGWAPRGDRRP